MFSVAGSPAAYRPGPVARQCRDVSRQKIPRYATYLNTLASPYRINYFNIILDNLYYQVVEMNSTETNYGYVKGHLPGLQAADEAL